MMINKIMKYNKIIIFYFFIILMIILTLIAIYQYSENNMYFNNICKINGKIINSEHKKLNNMVITNLKQKNNILSNISLSFNYNNQLITRSINDTFNKMYNPNDTITLYYDSKNDKLYKNNFNNIKYLLIILIIIIILLCIFLIFYKNNHINHNNNEVFNIIEKSLNNNLNEVK